MERYAHLMDITALSGFSIRLALAIILGFFVGLERQWTKHQAGILTNVIVCVGAYAYTAFSFVIHQDSTDLTRVAAQVVSGVGFLGAGLILRDGTNIRGLSTAATIWTTAAIGILCTLPKVLYAVIVAAADQDRRHGVRGGSDRNRAGRGADGVRQRGERAAAGAAGRAGGSANGHSEAP